MNPEIRTSLLRVLPFAIVLIIILVRIRQGKIQRQDIDLKKPYSIGRFLLWTLSFLLFVLTTEWIFFRLGVLEVSKWTHPPGPSVIRILGAVVLAPITEELLFRGLILNVLKKRVNTHLAILIQAIIFVLLHNFTYANTMGSNIGIVQGLIDASLFSYARFHTRSLYTSMTMHMTGNLIAIAERFVL
jgi:membrane protease YdiL (CAAX protease family)